MKETYKKMLPVSVFILVVGAVLLLISHIITENKIDLYNVDFKNFGFKKNQTYKYEVEIIGDYFYRKDEYGKYNHGHHFYYHARLKNKYNDNIYVVYELNDGARINMIKENNRTFIGSGVIKNISSKMESSYQNSLSSINSTSAEAYDLYFTHSTKSLLFMFGVLFMIFIVLLNVVILPLSYLVNKKVKFSKEA